MNFSKSFSLQFSLFLHFNFISCNLAQFSFLTRGDFVLWAMNSFHMIIADTALELRRDERRKTDCGDAQSFFLKEFWKKKSNLRDANFNLFPFISSRERERWFRANWDCSLGGLDERKTFLFVVFMLSSLMGKQKSHQQKKISWSKKQFQDFFQSLDLTSLRDRLIRAQQKMTSRCELAWEFSLCLLLEKDESRVKYNF